MRRNSFGNNDLCPQSSRSEGIVGLLAGESNKNKNKIKKTVNVLSGTVHPLRKQEALSCLLHTQDNIMNTILTAGQLLQKLQEATGMILPVLSGHILSHKYLAHNLDDHENI